MLFHATGTFTVDKSAIPDSTEETRVARALVLDKTIVHAYVREDRSAAILILEAETAAAAEAIIASLPFAADGIFEFETFAIVPLFPDLE